MTEQLEGPISVQSCVSANAACGEGSGFISDDSFQNGCGPATAPTLPITGERFVPGMVAEQLFREHEARYVFASTFVKGKRVLDVACGSGIGTHYLLRAGAHSCLGLDIDRAATGYAKARYKDCVFAQCDATSLCIADASVDAVVSFETIEHVKDQRAFLLECRRVLRPGGILVCSTPNRILSRWGEVNPFHLRELTVAEFADLLRSPFTQVQLYAQKSRIYPLYVGRRVLIGLLDKLQLTEPIRRFLRGRPVTAIPRTEFGGDSNDLDGEIQPGRAPLLHQPTFVIAVARKPLR
jgi:2-polyprenyl-3-methyl-5-hydroxy-6-metoxy-1,4-benzoquinol methylase